MAEFFPIDVSSLGSYSGSFSGSFSGSLLGTSSFAVSASWAPGDGSSFPYIGVARITGSIIVSGTYGGINTSASKPSLFDGNGVSRVVWGQGALVDASNATSVDWQTRYLQDSAETTKVDWENSILSDASGVGRVFWNDGALYDSTNIISIDWESRRIFDTLASRSADFSVRYLIYPDGATAAVNYGTQGQIAMTGSVSVTGSLTVSGSSTFTNIGPAVFSGSVNITSSTTMSSALVTGNVQVLGTASINVLQINTTINSTGSNQLGDAANDTQMLYGSVRIPTGSLTVTGSTIISSSAGTQLLVGTSSLFVSGSGIIGAGTLLPTAQVHISASDSSSAYSFLIQNGFGQTLIGVQNNRTVNINSTNQANGNTTIGTTNGSITFNQGYNNTLTGNALTFYGGGDASTIQGWPAAQRGTAIGYTQTNTNPNTGSVFTVKGTLSSSGSGVLFVTGSSTTKLLTIASEVSSSILVVSGSGNIGINSTGSDALLYVRNTGDVSGGNKTSVFEHRFGVNALTQTQRYGVIVRAAPGDGTTALGITNQAYNAVLQGYDYTTNAYRGVSLSPLGGSVSIGRNLAGTADDVAKFIVRGLGSGSVTTTLRVENLNASASLVVLDNGFVGINTGSAQFNLDVNGTSRFISQSYYGTFSESPSIYPSDTSGNYLTSAASLAFVLRNGAGGSGRFIFSGSAKAGTTTATQYLTQLTSTYNPTSGTGLYTMLELTPTINQTGGANGITRGIYVNPTLTSAADFRVIETTSGSVIFGGSGSSLTVGTSSLGPSENTITLGARDTTQEGGQIGFNAPGGTYTSASMIDLYQNRLRILKGTNAGSTAEVAWWSMNNLQMALPGYNSATAFTGSEVAMLGTDSNGNILTTTIPGAVLTNNYVGTGFTNPITTYMPFGAATVSGTESQRQVASPVAGTIKNFYLRTNNAAPATSFTTWTVRVNGVNTGITLVISGGQAAGLYSNTTNSASITLGAEISLQVSTSVANSPQVNQYSLGIYPS